MIMKGGDDNDDICAINKIWRSVGHFCADVKLDLIDVNKAMHMQA